METLKVRRPVRAYITHGLWMILTLFKTLDSPSLFKYMWAVFFLVSAMVIVRQISKKHYMELTDSALLIYTDFFRTKTINRKDIQSISVESSPFKDSKIILKDQKQIKFNYYNVNDNEFRDLLQRLNVQVS